MGLLGDFIIGAGESAVNRMEQSRKEAAELLKQEKLAEIKQKFELDGYQQKKEIDAEYSKPKDPVIKQLGEDYQTGQKSYGQVVTDTQGRASIVPIKTADGRSFNMPQLNADQSIAVQPEQQESKGLLSKSMSSAKENAQGALPIREGSIADTVAKVVPPAAKATYKEVAQGLATFLGAPVDVANDALNQIGIEVDKPYGGYRSWLDLFNAALDKNEQMNYRSRWGEK